MSLNTGNKEQLVFILIWKALNSHVLLSSKDSKLLPRSYRGNRHPRVLNINKCCETSSGTKQPPEEISAKRLWVSMLWMESRLALF